MVNGKSLMQSSSSAPARRLGKPLLSLVTGLFIAGLFLFFARRGLFVYYSSDDLMNLYGYWTQPAMSLVKANVFFWTPSYRPFGGLIYRTIFAIFGFNPHPLYVAYFVAMLANLWLAYFVFKRLGGSAEIGAIAVLLYEFHGKLDYLYFNAGSMYDVFCFLFFSSALLIYMRVRMQGRLLGIWGTLAFLACFVSALNSKEMAATLPVIVLVYELIFHSPNFRSASALLRWCFYEGRTALLGALFVLIYLPAKLGPDGFAHDVGYIPSYTWARWLQDTGTYLAYVIYRNDPSSHLGVSPLTAAGVGVFFGVLIAIALWVRSRVMWFGLLFFVITLLPVSFIPARLGSVLYLPLAGLALAAAVCLVRFKDGLWRRSSEGRSGHLLATIADLSPRSASAALFLATALAIAIVDYRYWPSALNARYSPYKKTIDEVSQLYPVLPHGAKILFVHSPVDNGWGMLFLLRLYYHDADLFLTQLNGPKEQRITIDQLPHYDHIFDFENGHYVELDNHDAPLSVQLHIAKAEAQKGVFGEVMTIGTPGAAQYIVGGVLVTDPEADGYWTLDQTELRFRLSSVEHHVFWEHFYLPLETLRKTGPLIVDFYVNGQLLDKTRFAKDGEVVYRHEVPVKWLKTGSVTTVRMRIHNPYVAPRDGTRLGVVLRSAAFALAVPSVS
jgi:hypothetical protein